MTSKASRIAALVVLFVAMLAAMGARAQSQVPPPVGPPLEQAARQAPAPSSMGPPPQAIQEALAPPRMGPPSAQAQLGQAGRGDGISLLPDMDLPVVVREGGIVVRAEAGMDSLAANIARAAPGYLDDIYSDLEGLPQPVRIDIRLVKKAEDLGQAAPPGRGAPRWASGVAYPDLGVVVVATRNGAQPIDVPRVVAHELAHLALGAALGDDRVPRWLHEGFAYLHSSEWSVERATTLTGMVWSGDVTPLHELDRRFPAHENEVDRAYAQSYDFLAFLARRGRYVDEHDDGDRWPLRRFLAEIASGQDVHGAAWKAYGASLNELFEEWRQDLRERYLLMPASVFALSLWFVAGVLLVLAYLRKRRQSRRTLARWEAEEAARWDREQAEIIEVPGLYLN